MKQLFLYSLLAAGYSTSFAQIQKGQSITSGSVGLSYYGTSNALTLGSDQRQAKSRTYGISVGLNRGIFFNDGWSFNYNVGAGYSRITTSDLENSSSVREGANFNSYLASFGVGLRRYWPVTDQLFVYAGGGLSYFGQWNVGEINNVSPGSGFGSDYRQASWSFRPTGQVGLLYALTNRFALEANVQSNGFPVQFSQASIGLALLTGQRGQASYRATDSAAAPQTRKGRWLVGVAAQVTGESQSQQVGPQPEQQSAASTATASVLIGRFVRDNVLVGVGADYTANQSGNQAAPGPVNYSITLNAYMRSYLGQQRLRPFAEIKTSYDGFRGQRAADNSRPHTVGLEASAGLAYLLGERFIIQTTLGSIGGRYRWNSGMPEGQSLTAFGIDARATMFSGFAVYYAL